MQTSFKGLSVLVLTTATLSACAVVPEPVEPVVEAPVIVEVPAAPTCYEVSALQRVEIPAETRTVVGISLIENPPYEPIEQRTEQKIVMKQAEVFYVVTDEATGNQTEVTNFCSADVIVGPVGPAPGERIGDPTQG
jgi:hypothetical protein